AGLYAYRRSAKSSVDAHTDDVSSTLHCVFFFNDTATTEIYTLSLHDALPISYTHTHSALRARTHTHTDTHTYRSEEHTSELQSHLNLVCRLLLEKKNIIYVCMSVCGCECVCVCVVVSCAVCSVVW